MFEVDPRIIDPNELLIKVESSVRTKNIPQEFFCEYKSDITTNIATMETVRAEMAKVYQDLQIMNATWVIREIPIVSNRRFIGPIIVFVKRVFRKLTRWLLKPYYEQQTDYNGAATRTISDMIRVQELLIKYCDNQEMRK